MIVAKSKITNELYTEAQWRNVVDINVLRNQLEKLKSDIKEMEKQVQLIGKLLGEQ